MRHICNRGRLHQVEYDLFRCRHGIKVGVYVVITGLSLTTISLASIYTI